MPINQSMVVVFCWCFGDSQSHGPRGVKGSWGILLILRFRVLYCLEEEGYDLAGGVGGGG